MVFGQRRQRYQRSPKPYTPPPPDPARERQERYRDLLNTAFWQVRENLEIRKARAQVDQTIHYPNGLAGMNLIDLLQIIADCWAGSKMENGLSMEEALKVTAERFQLDPLLATMMRNTALNLGLLPRDPVWRELGDGKAIAHDDRLRSAGYASVSVGGIYRGDVTEEDIKKACYHPYLGGSGAWAKDGKWGCTIYTD